MSSDERKQRKLLNKLSQSIPQKQEMSVEKKFELLLADVQKVYNYMRTVENSLGLVIETLNKKGVCSWADIKDVEFLFKKRDALRQDKIKSILSQDLTLSEILEQIKESEELPNYEKLSLNPIKDLNVNPYELASHLKEALGLDKESCSLYLRKWGMTLEHFGFQEEKK